MVPSVNEVVNCGSVMGVGHGRDDNLPGAESLTVPREQQQCVTYNIKYTT